MKFSMICAMDRNNGIGKNNTIPWHLPNDLEYFQHITIGNKNNAVIMGRKTWESIPERYRPLKNRLNIIITSHTEKEAYNNNPIFINLQSALDYIDDLNNVEEVFVIGGQMLYEEGIKHQNCDKLYVTELDKDFGCDRFFPKIDKNVYKVEKRSLNYIKWDIRYNFVIYKK